MQRNLLIIISVCLLASLAPVIESNTITIKETIPHVSPIPILSTPEMPRKKCRFASAPEPGLHPRVLLSPSELPALRKRLVETPIGRTAIQRLRSFVAGALYNDSTLGKVYTALVIGDLNALDYAGSSWWRENLPLALCYESLDNLIREDAERGARLAAALATYVKIAGASSVYIGLTYDFAYPYMTDAQRDIVRKAIATATAGKTSHGMGMPAYFCNYNWMPHGTQLALLALAIEGEEGYDSEIYRKTVELMSNFLTYGIYPSGTPAEEDMHYFNFGMAWGALTLVAMAKRGDVYLWHPHFQALRNWYIHSLEPFGYAFSMHADTINDSGGLLPNYALMKWVSPNDPEIDFIWRNRIHDDYAGNNYYADYLTPVLFGLDWFIPYEPAALNLPLSYFSANSGLMITRSDWTRDGLALHFEVRPDVIGPSHTHSDRNNFTLSALGRKWAIDRGFHIGETKDHSCVLIDGKGQGFFGPAGKFIAYLDSPLATVGVGDAKYAYDYRYTFKGRLNQPENQGYTWEPEYFTWQDGWWSRTTDPTLDKNGNPTYRAVYNPVLFAFRTAMLVRGQCPYVLILDDIQKNEAEHLYEWLMQTPNDLSAERISAKEIVLHGEAAGENAPQLLVRVLDSPDNADMRLEAYEIKRSPESGSTEQFGTGKRLVISAQAVAPHFKILLYPHRAGAAFPQTVWSEGRRLRIEWEGQRDEYEFQILPDGQVGFGMVRNGGEAIIMRGIREYRPAEGVVFQSEENGANIVLDKGILYLSGQGWRSLTISGIAITEVISDGSVALAEYREGKTILTER